MIRKRAVSPKKLEELKYIRELINKYNVVGLVHLTKMPAKSLHSLRTQLRGDVVIHMTKKRLFKRALDDANKPNLHELGQKATGITALLFTNMNPIKLASYLKSKAVKGPAKPGDISPSDILVLAGDTKIAPGPVISDLNQHLKVPTMIKNGTIHIRQDTITHKKGDVISDKAALLLTRLGIEPMTIELDFYAAWENGEVIPDAVLHMDVNQIIDNFRIGAAQGLNLAVNLGLLTPETVIPLTQKAIRTAINVAMELPVFMPDLLKNYIQKAVTQANSVNSAAFGIAAIPTSTAVKTASSKPEKISDKDADKKKSDDEIMGDGLSSLFP
jgi:large subunit ribosomal protein L10